MKFDVVDKNKHKAEQIKRMKAFGVKLAEIKTNDRLSANTDKLKDKKEG